jgi:hypothetical protein
MLNDIPKDVIIVIITFLSSNDVYCMKEINTYLYFIFKLLSKHPLNRIVNFNLNKQPDINYICSSKNLFKWAKNHPHFYHNKLPILLARNGELNLLKFIFNNRYKYDPEIYYEAAKNSFGNENDDIVKWCFRNNFKPNEKAIQGACESGNLNLVKWMDKNKFPFNKNACNMAAYFNHLDILRFLIEKEYPWDKEIYDYAAKNGNIRILAFLLNIAGRDLSIPWWDENTLITAAKYNQFKTLKWLRKNRCPWNIKVIYVALECKNIEMIKWCINNGCPTDSSINAIIL